MTGKAVKINMALKLKYPLLLLFPPRCIVCGKVISRSEEFFCGECAKKLVRIKEPRCEVCGGQLPSEFAMARCADCQAGVPYDKCFVPFEYRDGVKDMVKRMKFRGRPAAFRYIAREIAAELVDFRPDLITFVPQNRKTRRKRGYNQTELIARELARLLKVPVKPTLIRSESGERQVTLNRADRLKNAARLYSQRNMSLSGSVLIVDDVITTGATMKACCKLLRRMGCDKVYGVAAAKTVL